MDLCYTDERPSLSLLSQRNKNNIIARLFKLIGFFFSLTGSEEFRKSQNLMYHSSLIPFTFSLYHGMLYFMNRILYFFSSIALEEIMVLGWM